MASRSQSEIVQKLASLQAEFKRTLPNKVAEIEQLWNSVVADEAKHSAITDCHRMSHNLVGSGGTFGAIVVTTAARELEQVLGLLVNESDIPAERKSAVTKIILKLKNVSASWQPSVIPFIQPFEEKNQARHKGDVIYLAEDDELLAAELITHLEQLGYIVKHFIELDDFAKAFKKKIPSAVIMGIMFKEGDITCAEIISQLKKNVADLPPIIFISVRNDIEARLAAANAGAQRYFTKPVDFKKLSHALHGLVELSTNKPFRVLFVDDQKSLLNFYNTVLTGAGMEVITLSNPLECLDLLEEFKPDVIVLDVYMPECTGPELAQVIRQDDNWAITPIMFLSSESDLDAQLDAMNLGGESFMLKPVTAEHLISAVSIKAKRSRWAHQINNDLQVALREGEFQLITSNQHDIVSTADVTGRIISVNDKFIEISGYSREELIGQNHRLLKSSHHSDAFYKNMWQTISRGHVWHGKICNLKKNGDEYWVESTIVPFLDEKGKPYKYVSARTDVTSVIQSEERLERSQEFANIGTWDWNIENGNLFWSERIWPLFGYKKEVTETTYDNFMAAIHPDDRQSVSDAVTNCVEKGAAYNIEHRVVWSDGSIHWLHERGDVERNKNGKPLHMLGVVQDITVRKQASIALVERDRQLQEAHSMAHIGNWQANFVTNELNWSDEIFHIFGYEPGSIEISVDIFRAAVHPDDLNAVLESEKRSEETGVHDVVHRIVRPDGVIRHVHELAKAELDSENNVIRLSGTVQDITVSVEAQQALIQAREEAEDANRAKSQFLSSMSHELRTPMNAIIGFGQLLKMEMDPPLTESQEENVTEIVKAGEHLLQLINQVLDLARIEAGHIDLSIETVALGEIVSASLQLMMPLAQRRGIEITITQNGEGVSLAALLTQEHAVKADRTRLKQILLNLLSNAVKYNNENGTITISCDFSKNNLARISISDTGEGLTLEQQGKLFKAFNRLEAGKSDVEGTGIGLVITKNIVELMGGNIGVDSEVGKGSTFWFELPCDNLRSEQKIKNNNNSMPSALSASENEYTVLYIEDNPANLRLVSRLLGRLNNIHMWSAHEPLLGLELAAEHKPDLILLDINLPGMDGFEVLKILRQQETTRNTPVIAISANAIPSDIKKGMDAGFDDYVTKPININDFLHSVNNVLLEL